MVKGKFDINVEENVEEQSNSGTKITSSGQISSALTENISLHATYSIWLCNNIK